MRLESAKPDIGVIVNTTVAPSSTIVSPTGVIEPKPSADAVIVNLERSMLRLSTAAGVIFCVEPSFFQKNTKL